MKNKILILAATLAVSALGAACGSKTKTVTVTPTPVTTYVQIERLARPAVNEGLIYSNAYLNAFNSIPPSADTSAAAAPVLIEGVGVISATWELTHGNSAAQVTSANDFALTDIAARFVPDVMRIDTTFAKAPAVTGSNGGTTNQLYAGSMAGPAGAHSGIGILSGGRKPEDPVMYDTLSVLTGCFGPGAGAFPICAGGISDGVSYQGHNANQGHKHLHGQSGYGRAATFPYLAKPN